MVKEDELGKEVQREVLQPRSPKVKKVAYKLNKDFARSNSRSPGRLDEKQDTSLRSLRVRA
jgi:hypothetical protein